MGLRIRLMNPATAIIMQDIANPVGELAREVRDDHDHDGHQDGGQRDAAPGRGVPQSPVLDANVLPGVCRGGTSWG